MPSHPGRYCPRCNAVHAGACPAVKAFSTGSAGKGRGGRPWQRKRNAVLSRDKHLCQPHLRAGKYVEATEVDHIIPVAEGGTDDMENLEAICAPCHRKKTQAEARRARAGAAAAGTRGGV